ncbi:MAG TPA: NAD(+) synthase [Paludibacteraceae bacterium]|nr:NAD(+) synthase [Paludibacteraceae bacterium]HPO67589.1 NAD(+) synthase [Paludibacteraceae bacterium]
MNHGFIRVAAAVPEVRVADCAFNFSSIANLIQQAEKEYVQVICFPELCLTGYTCGDLFFQKQLLEDAEKSLNDLQLLTASTKAIVIVGMPLRCESRLLNAAVVLQQGKILGIVPKTFLPNYNEFYEKRWFTSAMDIPSTNIFIRGQEIPLGTDLLFSDGNFTFGIEICEDVWSPLPPSTQLCLQGAEIIFNLSASNELVEKHAYRLQLIQQQSARCHAGYVYASAGEGESTTDLVFTGPAIIAENGKILESSKRFTFEPQLIVTEIDVECLQSERMRNNYFHERTTLLTPRKVMIEPTSFPIEELKRMVEPYPFIPSLEKNEESCREIFSIQMAGLAKRWLHTKSQHLLVGISGGLDSTLALLVCVKTADQLHFDRKRIMGITMPGFGTSEQTYTNAYRLMKSLGITILEIPIKDACLQHFKDIGHDPAVHDTTYENAQARERTQILMDLANKYQGLVVGTGNLSELALGWTTYNGDHMSMYAVNSGIPKTLVRCLVEWTAKQLDENSKKILKDILQTPVSPELLPAKENGEIAQKTEEVIGPYELHDFFLYYFIRFGFSPNKILFLAKNAFKDQHSEETLRKWLKVFLRRFFSQQYKRSCMPDGPKVGSVNLSPRGDWRMPSDVNFPWEELL